MAWPDPDHPTPGSLAHQWAQAHQFEGVAEDVAVRTRVLVGQGHQRPGWRLVRIGPRRPPACEAVADPPARELLEQQPRDVPAPVAAHVHDQAVAVVFDKEGPVELGEARRHHIRNMDVAHAAPTGLVDQTALAFDPFAVPGWGLVADRLDRRGPRLVLAVAPQGEHDLVAGLVHQALTRRDVRAEPLAID